MRRVKVSRKKFNIPDNALKIGVLIVGAVAIFKKRNWIMDKLQYGWNSQTNPDDDRSYEERQQDRWDDYQDMLEGIQVNDIKYTSINAI